MKVAHLNHVAIHVADLERSRRFYSEVLSLEPMARPAFPFPGAWFRIGKDQELHLIAREAPADARPPSDRHFALLVESIADAEKRLRAHRVEFTGPKQRPDGAMQIFLRDPDGHVIELCTAPARH